MATGDGSVLRGGKFSNDDVFFLSYLKYGAEEFL